MNIELPKKNDVVRLVKVSTQVPQGIIDKVNAELSERNKSLNDEMDVEFLIPYLLDAWADATAKEREIGERGERERKPRKNAAGNQPPTPLHPVHQSA